MRELPLDKRPAETYDGSGWCFFEQSLASLMTEGGGHMVELGVGRVTPRAGKLPPVAEVEACFHDERRLVFTSKGDRTNLPTMYKELREKLAAFDEEKRGCYFRCVDDGLTSRAWSMLAGTLFRSIALSMSTKQRMEQYRRNIRSLQSGDRLRCGKVDLLFLVYIVVMFASLSISEFARGDNQSGINFVGYVILIGIPLCFSRHLRAHIAHFALLVSSSYGYAAAGDTREYVWNGCCRAPLFRPRAGDHLEYREGDFDEEASLATIEMVQAATPAGAAADLASNLSLESVVVSERAADPVDRPGRPLLDGDKT